MKIFLDTANKADIERFLLSNAVCGVTTNPSLVAKEQKMDYDELLQWLAITIPAKMHLSVEVTTLDPAQMYNQACHIVNLLKSRLNLFIKIPVLPQTLRTITSLYNSGINVNATACMTALQAKMAHDCGAAVVSFFYNRMIDHNSSIGLRRVMAQGEIAQYKAWNRRTAIICGSIRKQEDIVECFNSGADIVTVSPKILDDICNHPRTLEAVGNFQKDIDAWLK